MEKEFLGSVVSHEGEQVTFITHAFVSPGGCSRPKATMCPFLQTQHLLDDPESGLWERCLVVAYAWDVSSHSHSKTSPCYAGERDSKAALMHRGEVRPPIQPCSH